MINSMTGYGFAEAELAGVTYAVEIKSVNSRFFSERIKLPDAVSFLAEDIEKLLRSKIVRGTVSYTLHLKELSAESLFEVNSGVLEKYVTSLIASMKKAGAPWQIDPATLLNAPGVVIPTVVQGEKAERLREFLLELSERAVASLNQMRAAEGVALCDDLMGNCKRIGEELAKIERLMKGMPSDYFEKLHKRVNDLLANTNVQIDDATVAREVAIYAERCDISEETSRLYSHIQQFGQVCDSEGQAGRRLDFLTQEMLREANTIASKASDAKISHYVVEIKCFIDRMKEQVQNVE